MGCNSCKFRRSECDRCRADRLEEELTAFRAEVLQQTAEFTEEAARLESRLRDAEKALGDIRDLGGLGTAGQIARRYFEGV